VPLAIDLGAPPSCTLGPWEDIHGGILAVDRRLEVVAGVALKGYDNANSLGKFGWLLLYFILKPATLLKFGFQFGDCCRLVAFTNLVNVRGFEIDLPTLRPIFNVPLEDDFHAVLDDDVHTLVPTFPDKARELVVTIGEGEIECNVALAYIRHLTDATDILEFLVGPTTSAI